MRFTKIVATLGPATSEPDTIAQLVGAGVDVFRLNFSHGTHEGHAAMIGRIREAARAARRHVAIMQDLSGPKIRTGRLARGKAIELRPGDEFRIAVGDFEGGAGRVSTTYAELVRAVRPGDRLLLDDGRIELAVTSTTGDEMTTTVRNGGPLGEHKGINAPGVPLPASGLTGKDEADLRFGIAQGVDAVALSFVRSGADLRRTRALLSSLGAEHVPLIAKVERPEAVAAIDDVLEACDGVMVARGDLGLELPMHHVPRVQKEITRAARARGLPVIIATQVLESMRTAPLPTRAEVSDAANAVDDGVDAIMLSGETAVGEYPIRAVETLDAIARDAETLAPSLVVPVGAHVVDLDHSRALCEAAVTLASSGVARAIVAVTHAGKTARVLAAFRPTVPIYAATSDDAVARRLAFCRGVVPVSIEPRDSIEDTATLVAERLRAEQLLVAGDRIVLVSVARDLARPRANFLRLFEVPRQ